QKSDKSQKRGVTAMRKGIMPISLFLALLTLAAAAAGAQAPATSSSSSSNTSRTDGCLDSARPTSLSAANQLRMIHVPLRANPGIRTFGVAPASGGTNVPVVCSGTVGKLTKWLGFASNSLIGDSSIFEDKSGLVGIGTTTPTSKLTVAGVIESTGGFKFADGTVQTTGGLASIFHDATLTGNGTSNSPLGIALPLSLKAAPPRGPPL